MPVTVAKTAGFCFGVQRAVDTVYQQLKESQLTGFPKLYTLGEIIHNPQVVEELRSLGAVAVDSLEQLLTLEAQANPPVPVIIRSDRKSIRSVFTHLARYKLQDEQNDLISAERHIKRAILDCYKYLCISIAENTAKFREEYKKVDLKLADNGTFLPTLDRLDCLAQEAFKAAKKSEIKKCDDDEQYQLYENAYNAYSAVDKHLVDSNEAILFASSHSKNTNRLTIISCIITIISIIVAIIMAII